MRARLYPCANDHKQRSIPRLTHARTCTHTHVLCLILFFSPSHLPIPTVGGAHARRHRGGRRRVPSRRRWHRGGGLRRVAHAQQDQGEARVQVCADAGRGPEWKARSQQRQWRGLHDRALIQAPAYTRQNFSQRVPYRREGGGRREGKEEEGTVTARCNTHNQLIEHTCV